MSTGWGPQEARRACAGLGELVRAAWEQGWQPADLHRLTRRSWGGLTAAVLGDAVAADVARHAPSTVDPRWFAQLEEMEASVWWDPATDHLSARAAIAKGGWRGVSLAVTRLSYYDTFGWPALERLGPLPGQASVRGAEVKDVDARLLTKVRMMLAKAESTPYEEEAEAFTSAAQKLMARHSIDRAMLDEAARAAGRVGGPAAIRLGVDRPYEGAKFTLLAAIAGANRCRAVWHQKMGFATVVGFEIDLRAVELLHASLLVQATAAMRSAGSRTNWRGESTTRTFRRSFLTGFAGRIGERLATATEEATASAAEDLTSTGAVRTGRSGAGDPVCDDADDRAGRDDHGGTALVRVLAEREAEVEEAVGERFPRLSTVRSRASLDAEGWHSGRAAAERAQLGVRGKLA